MQGCGVLGTVARVGPGGALQDVRQTRRTCGSRYCEHCGDIRTQATYAAIHRHVSAGEDLRMLTVTRRLAPRAGETCAELATRAVDELQAEWRQATARARTGEVAPPRRRDGSIVRTVKRRCSDGRTRRMPISTCTDRWYDRRRLTYVAVLQVAGLDRGRYHAHLHVLCPDLATAELLNAAWQAGHRQGAWRHTDITEPISAERGAGYVSRYVSSPIDIRTTPDPGRWSGQDLRELAQIQLVERATPPVHVAAVPIALRGRRVVNGAGRWRSLGLSRTSTDDPRPAVYIDDVGRVHSPADWHGGCALPLQQHPRPAPPAWHRLADVDGNLVAVPSSSSAPAPIVGRTNLNALAAWSRRQPQPPEAYTERATLAGDGSEATASAAGASAPTEGQGAQPRRPWSAEVGTMRRRSASAGAHDSPDARTGGAVDSLPPPTDTT